MSIVGDGIRQLFDFKPGFRHRREPRELKYPNLDRILQEFIFWRDYHGAYYLT